MIKSYKIDKEIYPTEVINVSIEAFEDVTTIEYKNGQLEISGENQDEIEELFWEFMNYVIWIINL